MKKQPRKGIGLKVEHVRVLTRELEYVRGGAAPIGEKACTRQPDNTNPSKQHNCVTVSQ